MRLVRAEVRCGHYMRRLFERGYGVARVGHNQVLCRRGTKSIMQTIAARQIGKRIPGDLQLPGGADRVPLAFGGNADEVSSPDDLGSRNAFDRLLVYADDFRIA